MFAQLLVGVSSDTTAALAIFGLVAICAIIAVALVRIEGASNVKDELKRVKSEYKLYQLETSKRLQAANVELLETRAQLKQLTAAQERVILTQ